jgi:hypothetical protein
MRRLLLSLLIFTVYLGYSSDIEAQKKDKKHGPPSWAPAHGYRAKTRHVYFPEYNMYYDTQKGVYINYSDGKWSVSANLPLSISAGNLKAAVQVELDLNTDSPQTYNSEHQEKYRAKKSTKEGKGNKDKHKKHK